MAKPILLVKAESGILTPDQISELKKHLDQILKDEYHLVMLNGVEGFKGLTFEVHGVDQTPDFENQIIKISGKDINPFFKGQEGSDNGI